MTSSVAGQRRNSKALPKAKLAPENGHSHCLVVCCPSDPHSFLNPGETVTSEKYGQKINEMHWKLQCLQPALVDRNGRFSPGQRLTAQSHNQCFKGWMNWTIKFCLICHDSPGLALTNYHFFKHLNNFLQGKRFPNQHKAQNAFQEFFNSQSMDFYSTEINKLIFHWQKCVDYDSSYFD